MIDPINLTEVEYKGDFITIVRMDNIPQYDISDYDINDDKEFKKYMKELERTVRNSYEYRTMVQYLRNNMDMNKCSIYENVSNQNTADIRIELHHSPFSLYDICTIVINKRKAYNESLEIEAVAKEVTFLHYKLLIGLIPLSETVHDLVHNSILFIPINKIFGKIDTFVKMYQPFMGTDLLNTLNNIIEYSKVYNESTSNLKVLNTNYLCLDLEEVYGIPDYNKIKNIMEERIKEIKENPIPKNKLCIFRDKTDKRYLR